MGFNRELKQCSTKFQKVSAGSCPSGYLQKTSSAISGIKTLKGTNIFTNTNVYWCITSSAWSTGSCTGTNCKYYDSGYKNSPNSSISSNSSYANKDSYWGRWITNTSVRMKTAQEQCTEMYPSGSHYGSGTLGHTTVSGTWCVNDIRV